MEKYKDSSLSALERAIDLTDRLTTEEQAAQLIYDAPAIERLGIPAYNWWNEALHGSARAGTATMFPQAIALAAMFDSGAMRKIADVISTEIRAKYNEFSKHGDYDIYKGLSIWSPNVNIFRDPRWGRGQETYGEDPFLTAELGKAFVRGLQGDDKAHLKTAACAKHFAVHSGPEAGRHSFDAKATPKDMEETYLPAFKALVQEAKVESVMGAYNRLNGEGACASEFLMGKLEEWGFDGHFVSDFGALDDFHEHHGLTVSPAETCAKALRSGCDLNAGWTYQYLSEALAQGLITAEDIRRACIQVMQTRIRLGMLDESTPYDSIPYAVVSCEAHKALALEAAQKSIVLLKNNGILPLDPAKYGTIGVIGPNADSRTALEGNYCGTADRYITFLEGIGDVFPGRVLYSQGCHLYQDRTSGLARANDRLAEAEAVAEHSDLIILCVGLDAGIEGEEGDAGNEFSSGDKHDLYLPQSQQLLVSKITETARKQGKPVIIVTAAGSAINVRADADAELHAWYPGQYGGRALADILFGKVSPSGKLPVTFYQDSSLLPAFTDYSMTGRTYRYTRDNIRYPFGYGLTYTKTVCSDLTADEKSVSVTVENIGGTDSDEVIEFYIQDDGGCSEPFPKLCGFVRVHLKAGEKKTVSAEIPASAYESVDENGVRAVRGRQYTVYAGTHQPDPLSEQLTGTKTVSTTVQLADTVSQIIQIAYEPEETHQ